MGKIWASNDQAEGYCQQKAKQGRERQAQGCFSVEFPMASDLLSWRIHLSLIIISFMSVFPTWEANETKNSLIY